MPGWRSTERKNLFMNGDTGTIATITPQAEAGATDNRMSLDPNDPQWGPLMESWKDGEEYTLTSVRVRQESPGEFTVLSAQVGGEGETEEPEPERTGSMGMAADEGMMGGGGYRNPAVARMLRGRGA